MKSRRVIVSITLALLLASIVVVGIRAAPQRQSVDPPGQMTYQGHLMDAVGAPVPDGSYSMQFAFYDAPMSGNLLWGPESKLVDVNDGYFSAILGQTDPIGSGDLAATTYLEITVSGETMTPRHLLTSVAFALVAGECVSVTGGGGGDAWLLTGNSGTDPDVDFIGTSDDVALSLAVNNMVGLRLSPVSDPDMGLTVNVVGGISHTTGISAVGIAIGGGVENTASGEVSTIGGGGGNMASGDWSTIGGGVENTASDEGSTIGGGVDNTVIASYGYGSTIGGGESNVVSNTYTTIAGGFDNTAGGDGSAIGGGEENTASGDGSAIGGGSINTASGFRSTVPGGINNLAAGVYSLAAGRRAKANHDGVFIWGDSTNADISSTSANQFIVRASGGVSMYTNSGATTGAVLASGSGSWSLMSDRNRKRNLSPVDGQAVLDALSRIEITTWSYISQADDVRHLGPMAQDFYTAFGLGENDTSISSVDADGVSLAAIQTLYERVLALEAQVAACGCGGD